MAKKVAAWGIDIGQYALKALRCRAADDGTQRVFAEVFDFIEYPKPLSSPDADPAALVADALKMFLSRNRVKGDKVVISVPGKDGLARFIKLPPVETKKIPDIVRYEAKQQIPFPLEEVVWDFQQMGAAPVEEDFALDCEVGIFAMKRDQVERALKPFNDAKVEVDIVQLTPLALFNWVVFDQIRDLPPPEQYDADNPPESTVVLSIGTETTDFVVTNGYKMWQRSLPVGGNHFTKALVKDMKMNYATAEHLKRNASKAEDPKALFQAMRPVFSDLLSEVERSMKFFSNMDRAAKIGKVIALGNAVKLPGLQKFLTQNLGFEVTKPDAYRGLAGPGIVDAPAFKENLLSYGVCYGLALQGLKQAKIGTNLLPPEITEYRVIRAKKPVALLAAALVLVGFAVNYFMHYKSVESAKQVGYFDQPVKGVSALAGNATRWSTEYNNSKDQFKKTFQIGKTFLKNVEGRVLWLDVMRSINACLPRKAPAEFLVKFNEKHPPDKLTPEQRFTLRPDVKITDFECKRVDDLAQWYAGVKTNYENGVNALPADLRPKNLAGAAPAAEPDPNADPNFDPNAEPVADAGSPQDGPKGPGWVFQLKAHHFFNHRENPEDLERYQGLNYLRRTLLVNLLQDEVPNPRPAELVEGLSKEEAATKLAELLKTMPQTLPVKKIGIQYPVFIGQGEIRWENQVEVDNPADPANPGKLTVPRYDVLIQFCWEEKKALPHDPTAPVIGNAAGNGN
ncbi:MAG: type IV pilus assembly protein PilM [Planctomycetes bacterium]|nr:type IV pilus assembly protein PilM [Planctomycetota bacterium]